MPVLHGSLMNRYNSQLSSMSSPPSTMPSHCVWLIIGSDADGIGDYEKIRATMVAKEWGYVGFAADIYGAEFHPVTNSTVRGELLGTYRGDAGLFTARIEAAVQAASAMPEVDSSNVGIMGYCFGGTGTIMYTLSGLGTAKAGVSFHGGLVYQEDGPETTTDLLVLSGGDDDTSTDIIDLENRLNTANGTWQITRYSDIQHAFTNWFDSKYKRISILWLVNSRRKRCVRLTCVCLCMRVFPCHSSGSIQCLGRSPLMVIGWPLF